MKSLLALCSRFFLQLIANSKKPINLYICYPTENIMDEGKSPLKVRIFSDRPLEFKPMWIITIIFLAVLIIFLAFKMAEKCPDVKCPEVKDCPDCKPSCETCPPIIKYENITTTQYVCQDKRVVENPDDCSKQLIVNFRPITNNEDKAKGIISVEVIPAC